MFVSLTLRGGSLYWVIKGVIFIVFLLNYTILISRVVKINDLYNDWINYKQNIHLY